MSGSAIFNDVRPDRIAFTDRKSVKRFRSAIFKTLGSIIRGGEIVGSLAWITDDDAALIPERDYGDLDFIVDSNNAPDILTRLQSSKCKRLIGYRATVACIVTLWDIPGWGNIQVDLFLTDDYQNPVTRRWVKLMRSADVVDAAVGIPGYAHKYLLRAMTAQELVPMRDASGRVFDDSIEAISYRGYRRKWLVTGAYADTERNEAQVLVEPSNCGYIRDVSAVRVLMLGNDAPENALDSFTLLSLAIKDHIPSRDRQVAIISGLVDILYGKRSQIIRPGEYEREMKEKETILLHLSNTLNIDPRQSLLSVDLEKFRWRHSKRATC